MKVTLNQVIAMNSVLSTFKDKVLSAQLAYFFTKLAKKVEEDTTFYYSELKKIIEKYGERDDSGELINNGTSIKIKPELQSECEAALNELAAVEVDLPDRKIKIDDLIDQKFTMTELEPLLIFIED